MSLEPKINWQIYAAVNFSRSVCGHVDMWNDFGVEVLLFRIEPVEIVQASDHDASL